MGGRPQGSTGEDQRHSRREINVLCLLTDQETVIRSEATSIDEYLDELPEARRPQMEAVRQMILANLPKGYEEIIAWGMIAYVVPLAVYPGTYNGKPLMYAALANQKHHMALYLTSIYMEEASKASFERAYRASGKRYDVGKSCVRFRSLDDLPLDLIAETIASTPVAKLVAKAKAVREE